MHREKQQQYGWVVVAAAFTLMFVGFAAAYSFAAFFTGFRSNAFSMIAFCWIA